MVVPATCTVTAERQRHLGHSAHPSSARIGCLQGSACRCGRPPGGLARVHTQECVWVGKGGAALRGRTACPYLPEILTFN